MPECARDGCAREAAAGRKGFCNGCYRRQYSNKSGNVCRVCGRGAIAKKLCPAHYSRLCRGFDMKKPLVPRYKGASCSVDGCSRPTKAHCLCARHYMRRRSGIPLDAPPRGPRPEGYVSGLGYRTLLIDGKHILEHRLVMSRVLGRPLLKHESVHHKNGDRLDNRPENLELWTKHQPNGQRVVDKVRWAREILALYGHLVPEARACASAKRSVSARTASPS